MVLTEGEVARRAAPMRRRVTCAAASTPASAASASRAAFCGFVTPPSQRLTLAKETPSRELLPGEVEAGANGA